MSAILLRTLAFASAAALTSVAVADVPKSINVSQDQLSKSAGDSRNWLHTQGSYAQTRYYPGSQINTKNVAKL
ncbi:MAG TPA: quinonprotein alcohol dehydrogenase, partial [Burkholderiales bacterium]|nr:quinonprotein alcohol dehydrogenase [Burkholderiales bacterium]